MKFYLYINKIVNLVWRSIERDTHIYKEIGGVSKEIPTIEDMAEYRKRYPHERHWRSIERDTHNEEMYGGVSKEIPTYISSHLRSL